MMIITLPSGKIGITWRHRRFKDPKYDKETCEKFMNGITDCEIYRLTETPVMDAALIAHGLGICKWPDAFCKALGRKASLTSALRKKWGPALSVGFSRDDRIAIWEEYWRYTQPQPTACELEQNNPFRTPIGEGIPLVDTTLPVIDVVPITGALVGPVTGP